MSKNSDMHKAKRAKNDEFYTQLTDIEKEMYHYREHFRGKVIYCNCDDPRVSNFFKFFSYQFETLGLKKLIATCYKNQDSDIFSKGDSDKAVYLEYTGDKNGNKVPDDWEVRAKPLEGDGDFRSPESIALLKQADIVVTNPPFSLFREHIAQLIEYDKKFIVLGNMGSVIYKDIFKLMKDGKLWIGYKSMGSDMLFDVPPDFAKHLVGTKKEGSGYKVIDGVVKGRASAIWFTNLEHQRRNEEITLVKKYEGNESDYPKYDNYDAINVDKVKDIPKDYKGVMGVPISFLDKYNPEQFSILGISRSWDTSMDVEAIRIHDIKRDNGLIGGKEKYVRLFIQNK